MIYVTEAPFVNNIENMPASARKPTTARKIVGQLKQIQKFGRIEW